ncbi:hypothetical protein LCGC14_1084320 [marine sediment metagenome]|uniref:Uncharacterized protein n=1 Tax=marine sediment metagenome TaxID=412755 RepID=A0A0F9MIR7_9ZZZZ
MPTLTDIYEGEDTRQLTHRVVIATAEELAGVQEIEVQFAPAKVPTATVRIAHPAPDKARFFSDIYIDLGFYGVTQRVFTGKVWNVRDDARGTVLKCVGKSWPLDTDYRKVVVTLDSTTSAAAVAALLDELGIIDYKIDLTAWTIATIDPVTLKFKTYGEAIMHIVEVGGGRWFEAPNGTVIVTEWDAIPSGTAARAYFSMQLTGLVEAYPTGSGISSGRPRLQRARQIEQVEDVKNRVFVRGAAITTVDSDGVENTADIEVSASAPSEWVLHADGSQSYNDLLLSNELIETEDKAVSEAARLVTLRNRLGVFGSIVVDGDPRLKLADTVQVEDPDYSGMTGNWFVEAYSLALTPAAFISEVELRGGDDIGSTINIAPIPLFTTRIEREVIGDRVWAVVTFDAKMSHDPDGSISTFAWADDQAPQLATGSEEVFSIRVDPSTLVTPWVVTLTVTDNDGEAVSLDRTVEIDAGDEDVYVPVVYTAFDIAFSCTPDGGETWNDQAYPAGGVISVACWPNATPGRACFGTDDGQIYLTTDFCASALVQSIAIAGGDNAIVDIAWDWRAPALVWAVTQDGRLYLSQDSGSTFAIYADIKEKLDLPGLRINHIGMPGAGGLWLYGGNGAGIPVLAYLRNVGGQEWGLAALGGDLLDDVIGTLTADLYIADAADRGSGLAIILNSATFTPAVYFNDDPTGGGSNWTRATGLPAKSQGIWIDYDLEDDRFAFQFNDNAIYLGDVNFAVDPPVIAASAAAATLTAGDEPNHGMVLTTAFGNPFSGAYLVSGEGAADGTLWKTWDRFATVAKLRPATGFPAPPAGSDAKMSAIGRRVVLDERLAAMGKDASPREVSDLLGTGASWSAPVAVAGITSTDPRVVAVTDQLWFAINSNGEIEAWGWGVGARSKDGGATWGATPDPGGIGAAGGGIMDVARDAGGRIWCLAHDGHATWTRTKIFWSDDEGDNWNLSETQGNASSTYYRTWKIVPHPSDENTIAVVGQFASGTVSGVLFHTSNRGTSWTVTTHAEIRPGDLALNNRYALDAVMLPNGRLVLVGNFGVGSPFPWRVRYTDDQGSNWSTPWSVTGDDVRVTGLFASPGGQRVAFFYLVDNTASPRDHRLMLSTDGGLTIAQATLATELQDFVSADFDYFGRFAMSPERDAIYLLTNTAVEVAKLSPVSAAGLWTNLTSGYPHASQGEENLAVVPRA